MLAHALSFGKHAEIICYGFNDSYLIKMLNKNRIGNSNVMLYEQPVSF